MDLTPGGKADRSASGKRVGRELSHPGAPPRARRETIRSLVHQIAQSRIFVVGAWSLAVLSWVILIVKARSGGLDFTEIWRGIRAFDTGQVMYFQHGHAMSFLYPPSAALLLAPFGAIPLTTAVTAFAVLQAAAISSSCVLALALAGRIRRWTLPLAVLVGSLVMPARDSMWLGNIEGVILALQLLMLAAAARDRWLWAAVAFGFALALKPVLLPLAAIFILSMRWKMLAPAFLIPILISAAATLINRDGLVFVTQVMPFLWSGQSAEHQNLNVALMGVARWLPIPGPMLIPMRLACAIAMAVLLIRNWRRAESWIDPAIPLIEASSIVMLGTLLAFSYSWRHYFLFLLPLLALYGVRGSLLRGWLAGAAIYLLMFPDEGLWSHLSFGLAQVRMTLGLVLLASALGAALIWEPTRRVRDDTVSVRPAGSAF